MKINNIEDAVYEGIRKTISRFRRKPFHYFTEADIHSSLLNDITRAATDFTVFRPSFFNNDLGHLNHISVSLVHQEYPTHFRYKKDQLLKSYNEKSEIEKTSLMYEDESGNAFGDRGNFDIGILNKEFVIDMLKQHDLPNALEEIIHKDNSRAIARLKKSPESFKKELVFAIEVKFIHPFNARKIGMLHEVIKDDKKLLLAHQNSNGNIIPINLVFCSTPAKISRGGITPVVDLIKEYIVNGVVTDRENIVYKHPNEVATIFIESFIGESSDKITIQPLATLHKDIWAKKLFSLINTK